MLRFASFVVVMVALVAVVPWYVCVWLSGVACGAVGLWVDLGLVVPLGPTQTYQAVGLCMLHEPMRKHWFDGFAMSCGLRWH